MGNISTSDAACIPDPSAHVVCSLSSWRKANKDVIGILMPTFYLSSSLTLDELDEVRSSWEMVESGSPLFLQMKAMNTSFEFDNGREWFFSLFFQRLFDVHPSRKILYENRTNKISMGIDLLITLVLDLYLAGDSLDLHLTMMAEKNHADGMKAVEYGIFGEVLFWTLNKVLSSHYTSELHIIWRKFYSRILQVAIPVSSAHELRILNRANSMGFGIENVSPTAPSTPMSLLGSNNSPTAVRKHRSMSESDVFDRMGYYESTNI